MPDHAIVQCPNFSQRIPLPVHGELIFRIPAVVPGEPCPDLLKIYILAVKQHLAENTLITVALVPLNGHHATKDQSRQMLP